MLKIFGFPLSPFVRKAAVVAREKGVDYTLVAVNPRNPAADFAAASPFRKMPAIQDGDYVLSDSTAIAAYLDRAHPEPAIFPEGARELGRAIWFEEFADTIVASSGGKVVFNRFVGPRVLGMPGDEAAAEQGCAELQPMMDYLESQVPDEGWLVGGAYSIADISIATILKTLDYVGACADPASHPKTAALYQRVLARPAWQVVLEEEHKVTGAFA
ncbi:MAG: glutathione S-transferase family protein [Sphingomonadales bacterium]|nr:glutathione S-transferase family protein [Sphingomonadales bacterium]MDE2569080.1 glutathione S-transferase family protein [Sphingomonadales bacterium]